MVQDVSDVMGVEIRPKWAKGRSLSIYMTPDHKLSYFKMWADFLDASDTVLGDRAIEVSPGSLRTSIDRTFADAAAAADAAGVPETIPDPQDEEKQIANPDYPVKPDPQEKWQLAQDKLSEAFEDESVATAETIEDKMEAVAELLVTMLSNAEESGTYPQKWGKRMLRDAWDRK